MRSHNEDSFLISPEKNLYVVSDGMGGYEAGEVASRIAVELIDEHFTPGLISRLSEDDTGAERELKRSLCEANQKILEISANNPSYRGMGCTAVVALIVRDKLHLGHVGDSRAYVRNQGGLYPATADHSAVMELVKSGQMSVEEARKSPARNRLSQAVGAKGSVDPEYGSCSLEEGDKVLLCSDGLWDMLPDKDIQHILDQEKPVTCLCRELIRAANDAGGKDNITAVLLQYEAGDGAVK